MKTCKVGGETIEYEFSPSMKMNELTPSMAANRPAFGPEIAAMKLCNPGNEDLWETNIASGTAILKGTLPNFGKVYAIVNRAQSNPLLENPQEVQTCFKDDKMFCQAFIIPQNSLRKAFDSIGSAEYRDSHYTGISFFSADSVLKAGVGISKFKSLETHPLLQATLGGSNIVRDYLNNDLSSPNGETYFWFDNREENEFFKIPTARYFVFGNGEVGLDASRDINSRAKYINLPQKSAETIQEYLKNIK